jgi:hypothetical protein
LLLCNTTQTYEEKGRFVDVYQQLDIVSNVVADLFPVDSKGVANSCKPVGYTGTPVMVYSSAANGANTPG